MLLNHFIEPPLIKVKHPDLISIRERLSVKNATLESNPTKVANKILKAQAFLLIDGYYQGLLLEMEGFEIRAIDEPETEKIVRGSREGFIETISVNLSMIRRRLAHPS